MNIISILLLVAVGLPLGYLYLLALAAMRSPSTRYGREPRHRFAIAIPAHNEEVVIGGTVRTLLRSDYPSQLFDVHVVADHCTDGTAPEAGAAGAVVHKRVDTLRGGKGAALQWLFQRILDAESPKSTVPTSGSYDAVVVFDADTQVAADFMRVMDARLSERHQAVQGQHRISNPDDGWFPALTWAMFIVDNRFQNLGRSNLGWSAKNMGDSICIRADVVRSLGWGGGLTEDYALRQHLLLEGIRIHYAPDAVGYGEAPLTWHTARAQRARWLRGTHDASRRYARRLLRDGLRRCDLTLLDGALQAYLPSYSSLTLVAATAWLVHLGLAFARYPVPVVHWTVILVLLGVYPLLGLAMERAPLKAYLAILSGPLFILWRTWLAVVSRFGRRRVEWVRTPRKAE